MRCLLWHQVLNFTLIACRVCNVKLILTGLFWIFSLNIRILISHKIVNLRLMLCCRWAHLGWLRFYRLISQCLLGLLNHCLFLCSFLLFHVPQVFQYFYKHAPLLLDICFIGVTNKFHIYLAINSFFNNFCWFFFVEMIKIFIWDFWLHFWLVWSFSFPQIWPIKTIKKWMCLYFIGTIPPKSNVSICYHFI